MNDGLRCQQVIHEKPLRRCGRKAKPRFGMFANLCDEHAVRAKAALMRIWGINPNALLEDA